MRTLLIAVLSWLLVILPIPARAQSGCGAYTADEWANINEGGSVLSYQDLLSDGSLTNASLAPEAYQYLVDNGYLPNYSTVTMDQGTYNQYIANGYAFPAEVVLVTVAVPGLGEVVIFVAGAAIAIYLSVQAGKAIGAWVAARQGNADPLAVRTIYANQGTMDAGRDSNGNCLQPQGYKWQARDKYAHGGLVHWHWFDFNVNANCIAFPGPRMEGDTDPGPAYQLIPGVYVFDGTIE